MYSARSIDNLMARLHPIARFLVTETLSTLFTAGGCALGIAGLLLASAHIIALFIRPFNGIPDEIGVGMLLLVSGLLSYRFGRKMRS